MQMTNMQKWGISVSKLGFGAMRLPEDGPYIDQKEVNKMVQYAVDHGINYFDTAVVYPGSEQALGIALSQIERDRFYIADKMPFWGTNTMDNLERNFQGSLKKLQLDYIDFYLMHFLNRNLIGNMLRSKALEWAKQKQKEGKIKYLGFSMHDDYEFLLEVLQMHDWNFVQIQYNYLDEKDNPGQKGYDELVARGIPVITMESLKGGILADISNKINKPFRDLGGSNASFAFRWLAEKPGIMTILSGMSCLDDVKKNVKIFENIKPLNDSEHRAIKQVASDLLSVAKVNCSSCGYCLKACPQKINIPALFKAWNTRALQKRGNWISGCELNYSEASSCIECGACLEYCPNKIDIPYKLRQLVNERK